MVTRIKNVDAGRLNRISGTRVSKAKEQSTSGRSSKSSRQDDVNVSSLSRSIGLAGEAVRTAPDVRSELIGPIREALANGKYEVSNLDIADRILRQVLMERKKAV
ncbi:MAG: flagellar biosynthesis anti-sigma factor FlgM [Magnetococcales bacterium]|nr:flagellar biosynthesis anti-sigma factor FlgM [Magnetococcales bacterium]